MRDGNQRISVPQALAFPIARAIAVETHYAVVIHGVYGIARFNRDGTGRVEWNEHSTMPGQTTEFDERTTVCI